MPGSYGARHALSAWGDCDPKTYKYHMGAPEELKSQKVGLIFQCKTSAVSNAFIVGTGITTNNFYASWFAQ